MRMEIITLTNRWVREFILPTDACWNASHHEESKEYFFWPTHVPNQYLLYKHKGALIPLVEMGRAFNYIMAHPQDKSVLDTCLRVYLFLNGVIVSC
jgi:hypothetical protein